MSDGEAGSVASTLNFYSCLALVIAGFFIGFALDFFGRKNLAIIGFVIWGATICLTPVVKTIYPGMLLLLIAQNVLGKGLVLNTPLLADYVAANYMGPAMGIIGAIEACCVLGCNSGYLYLLDETSWPV